MEALAKPRGKPTTCNSSSKRICVEGEQSTSIARSTWGIVNGGMRGSSKAMPSPRERRRTDAATARQEDRNGFSPRIPHNGTWLRGSAAAPPGRNVKPKDITAAGTGITPGKAFAQHPSITKITPTATRFDLLLLKNRTCARCSEAHRRRGQRRAGCMRQPHNCVVHPLRPGRRRRHRHRPRPTGGVGCH